MSPRHSSTNCSMAIFIASTAVLCCPWDAKLRVFSVYRDCQVVSVRADYCNSSCNALLKGPLKCRQEILFNRFLVILIPIRNSREVGRLSLSVPPATVL